MRSTTRTRIEQAMRELGLNDESSPLTERANVSIAHDLVERVHTEATQLGFKDFVIVLYEEAKRPAMGAWREWAARFQKAALINVLQRSDGRFTALVSDREHVAASLGATNDELFRRLNKPIEPGTKRVLSFELDDVLVFTFGSVDEAKARSQAGAP